MVRDEVVRRFPGSARRVNNLTAGALRGPGELALKPLVRAPRTRRRRGCGCIWEEVSVGAMGLCMGGCG